MLLLDEPLSNLDPALRERTRRELRALIRRIGITTVIVTHEQEDAFDLGDAVAVLRSGRLEQVGAPEALYREPATPFVGGFIGRSSWLDGTRRDARTRFASKARCGGSATPAVADGSVSGTAAGAARKRFALDGDGQAGLRATVTDRRFAGASAFYLVDHRRPAPASRSAGLPDAAVVGQAAVMVPAAGPGRPGCIDALFPGGGRMTAAAGPLGVAPPRGSAGLAGRLSASAGGP